MGDWTAVDTAALAAAGQAASTRSRDVLDAAAAAAAPLRRLAAHLPGTRSAGSLDATGAAAAGALGEVGAALGRLGLLLTQAAAGYAAAESRAQSLAGTAVVPAPSAPAPSAPAPSAPAPTAPAARTSTGVRGAR